MDEEFVSHTEPNVISHQDLVKQLSCKKSIARIEITGKPHWCRWCPICKEFMEHANIVIINKYYSCVKCKARLCAAAFITSTDYEAHKMCHRK